MVVYYCVQHPGCGGRERIFTAVMRVSIKSVSVWASCLEEKGQGQGA